MQEQKHKIVFAWPDAVDLSPLRAVWPEAEFDFCPLTDPRIFETLADAEVLIAGGPPVRLDLLDAAPKLKWLQVMGAGMPDLFFKDEFRARGLMLTNGRGVNVTNLAEHAILMMLMFARDMLEMQRRQTRHEWLHPTLGAPFLFELEGQTLGLLGYGAIGQAVAKRAKALGMTVWAMRRAPSSAEETEADRVLSRESLPEILAYCDHILLCLPATGETEGMMGTAQFKMMKSSAYLYNMGRGKLVDHAALIEALRAGEIAGAGLDVTDPEPLPPDSPLWDMPNVLITGHVAGTTSLFFSRMMGFIANNLERYRAGQPLRNIVDTAAGY